VADPQAAALGISSARLRVVQAGALVALCLFSGLFISLLIPVSVKENLLLYRKTEMRVRTREINLI
jgi:hypothetical protein